MARNIVDFMSAPSLQQLRDANVEAAPYCDSARPSQAWLDGVRADGRLPCMIYESVSTWSQGGYKAGSETCVAHEQHIKATGHTGSVMVVVSDGSAYDPNYGWDNIFQCGKGWSDNATLPFFPYGNVFCCEAFIAGADAGAGAHLRMKGIGGGPDAMIPETWGYGCIATQLVGPSPIPNTDLDIVHVSDLSGGGQPAAPGVPSMVTLEVPLMHRAIMVNGLLDVFEVRRDDADGRATLWWTHQDSAGTVHDAVALTKNCDANAPDIDILPSGFGPLITVSARVDKGKPPKYIKVRIVAYGYVAENL